VISRHGSIGAAAGSLFLAVLFGCPSPGAAADGLASGVPTPVVVRVVANHAMALGDSVGGATVTITDIETGAILAFGTQTGASGDPRIIMQTPRLQGEQIFSVKETAAFTTELRLIKPTLVEITGEGPLNYPHAKRRASKTVLLYPGKAVTGDGIVLELNGLIVTIEGPAKDRPLGVGDDGTLRVTVKMMCGCIVEPFGNWDSRKLDLYGEMRSGDKLLGKIDLYHRGPKGEFTGTFTIPRTLKADKLTLRVVAAEAEGANEGVDEITYALVPWEQSHNATGREIPPTPK
jgi:hypothetical protein